MKHTTNQSVVTPTGKTLGSGAKTYEATGVREIIEEEVIVGTNVPVDFDLDVSACVSFVILSDRIVTVKTNSSSSPADTLVLKAGVPYIWNTDSYDTFKLGTDVTSLFITNASGGTATVSISSIVDPTP